MAPLADNAELQLAARQQLDARLPQDADRAELEAASGRLERRQGGRWCRIWAVLVVTASLILLAAPVRGLVIAWLEGRRVMSPVMMIAAEPPEISVRESLSQADRLLLFGDETVPDGPERWRPLWESAPENPMFFIEYALAYESEHEELPPDFLATGERIDPANGWYPFKMATLGAKDLVEQEEQDWDEREAGSEPAWIVHDEAELARRIAWIKQAAAAERIESYQPRLLAERLGRLPEPRELIESIPLLAYIVGVRIDMFERHLTNLIAAEARRCRREGDRQGFAELAEAWEKIFESRLAEVNSMLGCLILNATMQDVLPELSQAAVELEVGAEKWLQRAEKWQVYKDRLAAARDQHGATETRVFQHGSMLSALSLPVVSRLVTEPPELTLEDLLPATRVEQALYARVLAGAGWLVLGLCLLGSLAAGVSQPPLTRRLAERLGGLLDARDACWIGALGVLMPLLLYLGLRHGTPLGRLDLGGKSTLYLPTLAHFIGLLLMWLVWPVAVAGWRAARRGRVLGWARPGGWTLAAVVAPLVGMACFGLAFPAGTSSRGLMVAGVACGGWSLLWWLARGWAGAFGNAERRVRHRLIARAARPAWLGAMLLLVGLTYYFHAEERRWFARDHLLRVGSGFTAYEAAVTAQMKKELRALME